MRRAFFAAVLAAVLTAHPGAAPVRAGGISADAGLTPPQGRWILRSQVRLMAREAPDSGADMSMDTTSAIIIGALFGAALIVGSLLRKMLREGNDKPDPSTHVRKECTGCGWAGTVSKFHKKCPNCGEEIY